MSKEEKFNSDINLNGNIITNMVIGSNSDMDKIGAIRFNPETKNLEYNDGTKIQEIITKDTNI
jgi:hypothetical protein